MSRWNRLTALFFSSYKPDILSGGTISLLRVPRRRHLSTVNRANRQSSPGRINYFIATIRPQYEAIFGDHEMAVEINGFFDLALPLGGLISIPFIGLILDHSSTIVVLTTLVTTATGIGILGVIPQRWAAYANVCLFVLYRPFYYTTVSDYTAKVFGFRTFGTVYGAIICLSGLFNFSQSGLGYLFHKVFDGNPVPVNILLLTMGLIVGVCLVAFVAVQVRGLKKSLLQREAEHAFAIRN